MKHAHDDYHTPFCPTQSHRNPTQIHPPTLFIGVATMALIVLLQRTTLEKFARVEISRSARNDTGLLDSRLKPAGMTKKRSL
jgi:hypothetical protein